MKKGLISAIMIALILSMFVSINGCNTRTPEEEETPKME